MNYCLGLLFSSVLFCSVGAMENPKKIVKKTKTVLQKDPKKSGASTVLQDLNAFAQINDDSKFANSALYKRLNGNTFNETEFNNFATNNELVDYAEDQKIKNKIFMALMLSKINAMKNKEGAVGNRVSILLQTFTDALRQNPDDMNEYCNLFVAMQKPIQGTIVSAKPVIEKPVKTEEESAPSTKKRGRPKKTPDNNGKEEQNVGEPKKKPRGRPRKNKEIEMDLNNVPIASKQ